MAELTYINLTENNVNYAANHNQGVEHIPGIPKISLSEVERVVGEVEYNVSKNNKALLLQWNNSTRAARLKHRGTPAGYFSWRASD